MRRLQMALCWCALSVGGCEGAGRNSGASATGQAPEVERPMALLAEASPEPGRTVSFFEAFEGAIVLGQTFPFGAQPLEMPEGMTAAQFFQKLTGKPAPQALVDADARYERLAATSPAQTRVRPVATKSPPPDTSNETTDLVYAVDDVYPLTGPFKYPQMA